MNARWRRVAGLVAMVLGLAPVLVACGTEVVLPILLITNTWMEVGHDNHSFDIDADPGVNEPADHGTFSGVEALPNFAGEFDFTGSWGNGEITMTIDRTPHPVVFTGSFTNDPDTLFLSAGAQTLWIYRNRNP